MSSSNLVVGGRGFPSGCVCGAGLTIFTSKTQENPGRKFYRCSNKKDPNSWTNNRDGHFFKWMDDCMFEEVIDAKSEAMEVKSLVEVMKEEALVMKSVIYNLKSQSIVFVVWLCVITIMVGYLVFRVVKNENNQKLVLGS